ncbi:TPA: pertactin-like passenger domain-containing protein [Neisseria gonorrhoeae]
MNYKDDTRITGATVSDKGLVAIKPLNNTNIVADTIHYKGDVLAVNKGKVELDFTPNIRLVGRLDNFSGLTDSKHKNLFENYVANLDSKSAGEINFNLAKDALWTMTGQSWLDKLEGQGTIDFNNDAKTSGRALHIGELAGTNKFLMHLNKDGIHSDMLYVKKGTSTPQEVVVKNLSEVLDSMNYGERLRFATVTNSKNEFVNGKKYIDDTHLMEDALTVEYSAHNGDKNNKDDYNKSFNGSEMTAEKAGDDYVNKTYTDNRQNVYLVKQATGNPSRNVKISMICSIQPHIMRSLWILMPNAKGSGLFQRWIKKKAIG